jgi:alpha-amylase
MQVMLTREGRVHECPVKITKGVTLEAGSGVLEIAYLLENLPPGKELHFGVEFNFAGMPGGADDRYFFDQHGSQLGQLGTRLDLRDVSAAGLADEWLGLRIQLQADRTTNFWAFPIETVSLSEGGFELVHQSVVLQPHWFVQGDPDGRWSVKLHLELDTTLAESRQEQSPANVKLVV